MPLFTFTINAKRLTMAETIFLATTAETMKCEISGASTEFVFSGTSEQAARYASAVELVMEKLVEYKPQPKQE